MLWMSFHVVVDHVQWQCFHADVDDVVYHALQFPCFVVVVVAVSCCFSCDASVVVVVDSGFLVPC